MRLTEDKEVVERNEKDKTSSSGMMRLTEDMQVEARIEEDQTPSVGMNYERSHEYNDEIS